jgi:hypothetical protein
MSAEDKNLATVEKLRLQVAKAEADLSSLKSRLANLESSIAGGDPPETGLDLLWKAALPQARTRSSKYQCRVEWHRIPKHERPTVSEALASLKAWNRCEEWRKDGNAYVPGLHRWIKFRQWENTPQVADQMARYKPLVKPINLPAQPTGPPATQEEIAGILGAITRRSS